MRIISKFEDFYDYLQYGHGESIVYERNMNLREQNKNDSYPKHDKVIDKLNLIFKEYFNTFAIHGNRNVYGLQDKNGVFSFDILIIGEKIIPYLRYFENKIDFDNITRGANPKNNVKIFNINDLKLLYQENNIQEEWKVYNKYFEEHLNGNYIDLYNKIRKLTNAPIITRSSIISEDAYKDTRDISYWLDMKRGVNLNPSLKRLGLSKYIDPYMIIQELELYLSKIQNPEQKVILDDKTLRDAKGFDNRSFKY